MTDLTRYEYHIAPERCILAGLDLADANMGFGGKPR